MVPPERTYVLSPIATPVTTLSGFCGRLPKPKRLKVV